ncbi:tRNA epoxyqueuosine(34) reductase QueG [Gluconacetobacter azotocaptans]|uniref:Epoxyqueuosine reductase n=1 Tax=Gluconacetobacter azotocaptans TaxID=142834 RepID=A0A7W4PF27_9PROT|nr:tRNA epoxyqueuosine(34) reductase QueG [Gluconacetobacter azotocaptans]MBB2191235.1 tRNA epoxyqueuosine(34) reductase QueG [Gluconacetobacter azotocaptans]GBQ30318.1 iron-sulfur binding protein [Gluconacetobacter azotocaptans DSM 13594]
MADLSPDAALALRERIGDRALALGFDAVGFCDAALGDEARTRLADFLAAGHHGSMGWLADRTAQRGDPRALWPAARSVIALGLSYAPGDDPLATVGRPDRGNISVYARNRDYHDVVKGMLKHLAQFVVAEGARAAARDAGPGAAVPEVKVFVDTAPVMEKPLAERAGLGWQGKHTNLVSRRHGSWLFLGEVYTTLALPRSAPSGGGCGTCRRCLDACPTGAFPEPWRMDARRCLSYLTIENPGPIPEEFRAPMGNRIYGCDDCLAVCPWNRFATQSRQMKLLARDELTAPRLAELAGLDDAAFRALFAGSPVKRIGRDRFVRNVLVAIGNSGLTALRPTAQALCNDADPVVAEAARWAVGRLPA